MWSANRNWIGAHVSIVVFVHGPLGPSPRSSSPFDQDDLLFPSLHGTKKWNVSSFTNGHIAAFGDVDGKILPRCADRVQLASGHGTSWPKRVGTYAV